MPIALRARQENQMMTIRPQMTIAALFAAFLLAACTGPDQPGDDAAPVGQEASQPAVDDEAAEVETRPMSADQAQSDQHQDERSERSTTPDAVARLMPTEGNTAQGTVSFVSVDGGVRVKADISGLSPDSLHGFHVHEIGDCSAPDATSAGDHYNPHDTDHGAPGADQHHVGDLGNLEADRNGRAMLEQVFPFLSLSGEHSIVSRAVIVHIDPDDLHSQPTGNAGARIACGVIHG